MRGNAELSAWGREALDRAEAVFVGSAHIREVLEDVVGHVDRVHEVPPGVDIDEWRPRPRDEALAGLLEEARRDPPNPGNASERLPDEGNAERLAEFLAGERPTVVYFGKLLYNKGVHVLLEALRELDARAVIVGFGDYREELEAARRPEHALHRPARAPAPRPPAGARGRDRRPVDLPGGVRHGRRRGRRRRLAAARRAPLRPGRDRRGARAGVPAAPAAPRELRDGRRRGSRAQAARSCSRSPSPIGRAVRAAARNATVDALELGGRRAPLAGTVRRSFTLRAWVTSRRVGYEELLAASREGFETGTDFTVAVEEEFALLDPATLGLVNRFEEVQAASKGTPLEPHLVGELIASEVEVKTGRCQTFADIPAAMAERRAQLQAVVDPLGIALGATGTHPVVAVAGAADHRHAALPAQRRAPPVRRLAQQHLRPARPRRHPRRRPGDRGHERPAEPAAGDPRAVRELAVPREREHRPPLGPHADLHALLPALRRAGRVRRRGSSTRTTFASSTRRARSPSTRSCGGASGRTWRSRPSRSGSPTGSPIWRRPRRWLRSSPRSPRGSRAPTTRESRSPTSRTG